jgi:hypothetical protein
MVNEASHVLDGEEVEMPSLPRTILNGGSEWLPRFCFYGINSEVPNRSPYSLGLQRDKMRVSLPRH